PAGGCGPAGPGPAAGAAGAGAGSAPGGSAGAGTAAGDTRGPRRDAAAGDPLALAALAAATRELTTPVPLGGQPYALPRWARRPPRAPPEPPVPGWRHRAGQHGSAVQLPSSDRGAPVGLDPRPQRRRDDHRHQPRRPARPAQPRPTRRPGGLAAAPPRALTGP